MKYSKSRTTIREQVTIALMIVAFFVTALHISDKYLTNKINKAKSNRTDKCLQVLKMLASNTEPKLLAVSNLLPLLRIIPNNKSVDINKVRKIYLKKYALDLNIYKFSATGKLVSKAPKRPPNLWLMKKLATVLAIKDSKKIRSIRKQLDKKIKFAFGYGKDFDGIRKCPEELIDITSHGEAGLLAWSVRKQGSVIIFCPKLPSERLIFNKVAPQVTTSGIDLQQAGFIRKHKSTTNMSLPQQAYNQLSSQSKTSGEFAAKDWFFLKTLSGRIVYIACSQYKNHLYRLRSITRLILMALFVCTLLWYIAIGRQYSLKLTQLVISMFIASALLPVTSIIINTSENISVYKEIEINKILAFEKEYLETISQQFDSYLSSCTVNIMKITENPGDSYSDPRNHKISKQIRSIYPNSQIFIRDAGANLLYPEYYPGSRGERIIFRALARRLVERYSPDRLSESKYTGNPFADTMVRKDDMGMGTILNYPNQMQMVKPGTTHILILQRVLPKEKGKPAVLEVIFHPPDVIKDYLSKKRAVVNGLNGVKVELYAIDLPKYKWTISPPNKRAKQLLQLAKSAWNTETQQEIYLYDDNTKESGLAVCIKSSTLNGKCLIAYYPFKKIERRLSTMKKRVATGAVVSIFLITLIAILISKQLIHPLVDLEDGVKALRDRKFTHQITVPSGKDEISTLFTAFNEMMAESHDMQVARSVQEGLITKVFPKLDDYSVHGMLRSANDLGGDCLDCFTLPNGNLLFLIGDITGHGVGSALIMAFSRAITFHWSLKNETSPISLISDIDKMLRANTTDRMFMGCICGILDIQTNEIQLVTKGHIYPLVLRAIDNKTEWIGRPSYPLGIGKFTNLESTTITMNPGDKLLAVTDGYLEALNKVNEIVGFGRIEEWLCQSNKDIAIEITDYMNEKFDLWHESEQLDDISMFALVRHKNGKNNDNIQ